MKMWLANVVWYDGCDSGVSKVVVLSQGLEITKECEKDIIKVFADNESAVLKIDMLYPLSLDNIIAFGNSDDEKLLECFHRFNRMYFND